MNLLQINEMAAKKECPLCGKSMAANHYWYKGGWKCKKAKDGAEDASATVTPVATSAPVDVVKPSSTSLGSTPLIPRAVGKPEVKELPEPDADQDALSTPINTEELAVEIEIIADVMPTLQKLIDKINKTAAKIGAQAVTMKVVSQRLEDGVHTRDDGTNGKYKFKVLTINMVGSTPRVTANDGSVWNFIGVITASAQGKALLKLTPGAGDTEELRKMYSANPFYCDHCRTTRARNETFIVQNGNTYKQVGRNCLKDFVGGADPQALLTYFAWFSSPEQLMGRLNDSGDSDGSGEGSYGRGGKRIEYLEPITIVAATLAVVDVAGGYVSAKAESGLSTTGEVRDHFWGTVDAHTTEAERTRRKKIQNISTLPETIEQAQKIIDWFKALPAKEVESNTFYQNIKIMVDEDSVESKQIGYIVGLYSAYSRAEQKASENKGNKLVKEWPEDWGKVSKVVENEHAVVKYVRIISGGYGSSQVMSMMLDNGLGFSWKYSGGNNVHIGDEFNITGELQPDDYFSPPHVKFVASRKWLRSAFKDE